MKPTPLFGCHARRACCELDNTEHEHGNACINIDMGVPAWLAAVCAAACFAGVVLFAKKRDIVDGVHSQFRHGSSKQPSSRGRPAAVLLLSAWRLAACESRHSFVCLAASTRPPPAAGCGLVTQLAVPSPYHLVFPGAVCCRHKTVRKGYIALAVGVPAQSRFTVDAPIDRDERDV